MAEREKQYKGIISYEKLWNLMQTKNIKKRVYLLIMLLITFWSCYKKKRLERDL